MSDDTGINPEKATVRLVYDKVAELRRELSERMDELDDKLDAKFETLLCAIDSLRGAVVTEPLCASRHAETEAALVAAMKGSEADRQKIWDAIHDGQNNLKWVIALVVTTLLAAIGALIESFII